MALKQKPFLFSFVSLNIIRIVSVHAQWDYRSVCFKRLGLSRTAVNLFFKVLFSVSLGLKVLCGTLAHTLEKGASDDPPMR